MPNNQANSGSDLLPIVYTQTSTSTFVFWPEPQEERNAEYLGRPVVTPSYSGFEVTGPSQSYAQQIATGTVTFKVTVNNIRISGAQSYCPVIYNSVYYQIATNVRVTLPQIVYDIINESGTFAAIIVP